MKKGLLLLLSALAAQAMTIHDAVEMGLKNHYQIAQRQAELEAAEAKVKAAGAPWLPSADLGYRYTVFGKKPGFNTYTDSALTAHVNYNLFRGGVDSHLLQSAKAQRSAQNYLKSATIADLTLQIRQAYLGWLEAIESLDIADQAVELLNEQDKNAASFFYAGTIPKNERLEVEVSLLNAIQEQLVAQSRLRLGKAKLERLIRMKVQTDPIMPELPSMNESQTTLEVKMLKNRSELKYLNQLRIVQEESARSYGGGYLPRIDLQGGYERIGQDVLPDGKDIFMNGERLFPTEQYTGTVTVSWTVFDGLENSANKQAAQKRALAVAHELADTQDEMRYQLKAAFEAYALARSNEKVSKKALEQAKEQYRIVSNRFEAGVARTRTLLDAQLVLTEARSRLNQTKFTLYGAYAALLRIVEEE